MHALIDWPPQRAGTMLCSFPGSNLGIGDEGLEGVGS
jgi:hypothetical protein